YGLSSSSDPWRKSRFNNGKRPYWEGAIYEESLVQVDKRIVTAMPNGYVDFGLAVAEALELLDSKQKQFILSYHKQGAH
ncbi:hypothetical protein FKN13_25770, partial [Vibrio sp. 2-2(9)]|nr:hypothetical protein [Vibrio sp. 2-2(9)]